MYRHYCKDQNCPGHTKSWERCCDMRAFAAPTSAFAKAVQRTILFENSATPTIPARKLVFA